LVKKRICGVLFLEFSNFYFGNLAEKGGNAMKCSEIMTKNPKMCIPNDNIAVAAGLMWDYDCGSIPVVTDMDSKELVGIVTDRDIAMHVVRHAYAHPSEVTVSDCMSTNVIFCYPEDPIESAMKAMESNQIHRVPVIDQNNSCIGLVSMSDLMICMEGMDEKIIAMMNGIYSRPVCEPTVKIEDDKPVDTAESSKTDEKAETDKSEA
jgi:CBS domain-containing protein